MALLHQSLFTGTNGVSVTTLTPAVGNTLFTAVSAVLVQDNRAWGGTGIIYTLNDYPFPTANYVVRCVFRQVSGAPSNIRIVGRDKDTDRGDCYQLLLDGTTLKLFKRDTNGANETQLGSTYTISTADGNDYTVQLAMNGSSISAWWQGAQVISVTDTTHTLSGYVFVGPQNSTSTTGWHLDTLEVDDAMPSGVSAIAAISSGFHVRNINR